LTEDATEARRADRVYLLVIQTPTGFPGEPSKRFSEQFRNRNQNETQNKTQNRTRNGLETATVVSLIPRPNDHRSALTSYEAVAPLRTDRRLTDQHSCASEFLQIRTESHRAPGILRQLRLAVWHGLTCRLYKLSSRVEAIKIRIEVCWNVLFLLTP
jgi:hypothetical protein